GQVCNAGTCEVGCPTGETACSGTCVNLQTDEANCGECGMACGAGQVCVAGTCESPCPPGQTECDGECVDTNASDAHCGGCGIACEADRSCVAGTCQCDAGLTECDGACVDTNSSMAHCGECNMPCAAPMVCSLGTCDTSCAEGLTDCDGSCVNTDTSNAHCGGCDMPCATGQVCIGGSCQCTGGLTDCGGTCTDTDTDELHCGDCDTACAPGQSCNAGRCEDPPPRTFVGALPPSTGRWNYGLMEGIPGADAACNAAFPGSRHCTRAEIEAAAAAGVLAGAVDTTGMTVGSLWLDDPIALDQDRCGSRDPESGSSVPLAPWTYNSRHLGCWGKAATINPTAGAIVSVDEAAFCNQVHHVGCCMP
ncbi:MAG TPA: MXAN_6577-like cysteine-rich protein, partial [Sandaracinaceae bacterium]